jgi:hypothetical protein
MQNAVNCRLRLAVGSQNRGADRCGPPVDWRIVRRGNGSDTNRREPRSEHSRISGNVEADGGLKNPIRCRDVADEQRVSSRKLRPLTPKQRPVVRACGREASQIVSFPSSFPLHVFLSRHPLIEAP